MRREDRERSSAGDEQHSRSEEETRPTRPASSEERIRSGPTSNEPQKTPNALRQSGRLPLPD